MKALRPMGSHEQDFNIELIRIIEDRLECDTSDAQGIAMVKQDEIDFAYNEGKTPEEAFNSIFAQ